MALSWQQQGNLLVHLTDSPVDKVGASLERERCESNRKDGTWEVLAPAKDKSVPVPVGGMGDNNGPLPERRLEVCPASQL